MTSRRTFLKANITGAAQWALISPLSAVASSPDSAAVANPSPSHRDFWNDWPSYLSAKMNQARQSRLAELAGIATAAQAQERAARIRSKVWELIGGPPTKTPLNAQIAGRIDRGSYTIEKVTFESLPRVYVTANLYIPKSGTPPFPAVLVPLGHAREGKAYRNYQYLFQNLARKGYVVLAYDPYGQGERAQYIDLKTGASRFNSTGEHSEAGRPLLLLGNTFALYRVWDGIRALDYLLSRSEVDGTRVACTGHSGGGTMTMYMAALEPRFSAAVVVEGNTENMAGPSFDPPGAVADAEQNIVGGLPLGIDRGDLLAAFTPKPLLICYTTHDIGQTYSPRYEEATKETYQSLQQGYALFGVTEKVGLFASHLPHDLDFFHRRATYEWFNRWLGNSNAGADEADFDPTPESALNCTKTGQVLTSLGGRSVVQVNRDRTRQMIPKSPFANAVSDFAPIRQNIRTDLSGLLALPKERTPLRAQILSSSQRKNVVIEEFQFESEPGLRLTGWFLRPSENHSSGSAILYLNDRGGEDIVAEPSSMENVLASGHAVCALSLRGLGLTAPRFPRDGPRFNGGGLSERYAWAGLSLGQPVIAQRVWDIFRGIDYLAVRAEVDPKQIRVLGIGGAGLAALVAVTLDERPRSLLLEQTIVNYASILESEDYSLGLDWFLPAILRHFDLPDLVATFNPRPCWLLNAVDARGSILTRYSLREQFKRRIDMVAPALSNLRSFISPEQKSEETWMQWVKNT